MKITTETEFTIKVNETEARGIYSALVNLEQTIDGGERGEFSDEFKGGIRSMRNALDNMLYK